MRPNADAPSYPHHPACVLSPPERLLLLAIRSWVCARNMGEPPSLRMIPTLAAKTSDRVAALFSAWMQTVEAGCRRPIRIQPTSCGCLSPDERRLVVSCDVGAVSVAAARAHLDPLMSETRAAAVLGRSLNAALAWAGWRLPVPSGAASSTVAPTLH